MTTSRLYVRSENVRRRAVIVGSGLLILVAISWAGWAWYRSRLTVFTDDAYVEGTIAPVSAKIPAQVVEVLVTDNQPVSAKQLLVRLDDRDWRARAEQARAMVAIAERRFQAASARIGHVRELAASQRSQAHAATIRAEAAHESATRMVEMSRSVVEARRAALAGAVAERDRARAFRDRAAQDLARARELSTKELVAKQFLENAETEARAADAQFTMGDERVAQAQRDLETAEADSRMREAGFEPQQLGLRTAAARAVDARAQAEQAEALVQEVRVREAERDLAQAQLREAGADLDLALLNLEHTAIQAPIAGVVSRKSVEVGQVVQVGQPLLAVVALHDVWVVANFKETQLRRVRPGMSADIVIDTFPDRVFRGTVESISAGTGSRFSILPPENASGNWVKVVQRVPVKILLSSPAPSNPHTLRAGMSVAVTIHVQ
jgi:membrane fusion protein, multidrug efflux system